jgi:hypothetical protein
VGRYLPAPRPQVTTPRSIGIGEEWRSRCAPSPPIVAGDSPTDHGHTVAGDQNGIDTWRQYLYQCLARAGELKGAAGTAPLATVISGIAEVP